MLSDGSVHELHLDVVGGELAERHLGLDVTIRTGPLPRRPPRPRAPPSPPQTASAPPSPSHHRAPAEGVRAEPSGLGAVGS